MSIFLHYDNTTGNIVGFYNTEILDTVVPEPNIILTTEEYSSVFPLASSRKIDLVSKAIINREPDIIPTEELLNRIRFIRNDKLAKTDWTQVNDSPLTTEKRTEWATYRQALRDFPTTCDPVNPVWPTEPTA